MTTILFQSYASKDVRAGAAFRAPGRERGRHVAPWLPRVRRLWVLSCVEVDCSASYVALRSSCVTGRVRFDGQSGWTDSSRLTPRARVRLSPESRHAEARGATKGTSGLPSWNVSLQHGNVAGFVAGFWGRCRV